MKKSTCRILCVLLLLAGCSPVWAQPDGEAGPDGDAGPANLPAKPTGVVKSEHMEIDLNKRQIVIQTEVCLIKDAERLEFVLSGWGEKAHESLLHTKATGKQIHFGLLLLGLRQGIPAEWVYIGEESHYVPPRGSELELHVRWSDKKGKQHTAPIKEWMQPVGKDSPKPPNTFVFIGSEVFADGTYWADQAGELISVSNFASAVLDVPFQSTDKDSELLFKVDRTKLPERETKVELILKVKPDAAKTPYARALVDIDADGMLRADGQPVAKDKLEDWAGKLSMKHPKAKVIVRADPNARVGDVQWAMEAIRLGGIFDAEVERIRRDLETPYTAGDRQRLIGDWANRFANPRDEIRDPGEQADEALEILREQLRRRDRQREVLQEYIEDLTRLREAYKKQAAEGDAASDQP